MWWQYLPFLLLLRVPLQPLLPLLVLLLLALLQLQLLPSSSSQSLQLLLADTFAWNGFSFGVWYELQEISTAFNTVARNSSRDATRRCSSWRKALLRLSV